MSGATLHTAVGPKNLLENLAESTVSYKTRKSPRDRWTFEHWVLGKASSAECLT